VWVCVCVFVCVHVCVSGRKRGDPKTLIEKEFQ
jgi:hypothetical protein